jgi:hypothetical protein
MSRGQGHVDRAVEAAFTENPTAAISTNYLIAAAYPDEDCTKSRRVAILRTADKVAARLGWSKARLSVQGGQTVYVATTEGEHAARGRVNRREAKVI